LAAALGTGAPKLLDASTAHRVDPEWIYGFPEMAPDQPGKIAMSRKVTNPGCYPTGVIGLLRPLVQAGLVPTRLPDHDKCRQRLFRRRQIDDRGA